MIYFLSYSSEGLNRIEDHQKQKKLSRALLDEVLTEKAGIKAGFDELRFGPHGKPYLKDDKIFFNLTNCRGLICCAIHDEEVGIDGECLYPYGRAYSERLVKRACTEKERQDIESHPDRQERFIQYWTLKESYMKYTGEGMAAGLRNTEFKYLGRRPYKCGDGSDVNIFQTKQELQGRIYMISICSQGNFDSEIKLMNEMDL